MSLTPINNYKVATGYARWLRGFSFAFLSFMALSVSSPSMAEEPVSAAEGPISEAAVTAGGEPLIEVFYPAPDSLFNNELVHLIAKVSGRGAAYVVVRVNEHITPVVDLTDEAYREILGDTLITRLYFLPGKNELELTVKDRDGRLLESLEMQLYYRDGFSNDTSAIPEQYVIRPMHTPDNGKYCKACHRMDVDPILDMEPEKKYDLFCVRCHEPGLLAGIPHGTATWRCLGCHETAGDPLYSVKDAEGKFCIECHSDQVERFKGMTSVHTDAKEAKCRSCHRMHNTREDGLISLPVNKLCYDCHEKVYDGKHITPGHPLEAKKDPSREDKRFDCLSCHDPHASSKRALMKHEPGMAMCQVCHSK